jgi:hypothetical protein
VVFPGDDFPANVDTQSLAHVHTFIVAISHRPHRANAGELAAKPANTFLLPIQTTHLPALQEVFAF